MSASIVGQSFHTGINGCASGIATPSKRVWMSQSRTSGDQYNPTALVVEVDAFEPVEAAQEI